MNSLNYYWLSLGKGFTQVKFNRKNFAVLWIIITVYLKRKATTSEMPLYNFPRLTSPEDNDPPQEQSCCWGIQARFFILLWQCNLNILFIFFSLGSLAATLGRRCETELPCHNVWGSGFSGPVLEVRAGKQMKLSYWVNTLSPLLWLSGLEQRPKGWGFMLAN